MEGAMGNTWKTLLAIIVLSSAYNALFATSPAISDELFDRATYRRVGKDGLVDTITAFRTEGKQKLSESDNIDLTPYFQCHLVVNIQSEVDVPPGYNQIDFLGRRFRSCAWTENLCGPLIECNESNVVLLPGRYFLKNGQLCAVWRTGIGDGVTEEVCYDRISRNGPVVDNGIMLNLPQVRQ
jgi:hypothetical protein